jgi:hypothetical protein
LNTSAWAFSISSKRIDLIGSPPHRLGQHAALLVADIAGRGADQPRHGVLLHELGHVDAHHRGVVVEEERGERLGELGLADAGRAEEHERADRPVRVLEPGAGAAHGSRDGAHRLGLADDPLAELVLHAEQLVALALEHLVDRDAGPARHDLGDVVRGHGLLDHVAGLAALLLGLLQLLLERRDRAVGELAGAGEVARPLRLVEVAPRLVELLLDLGRGDELLLLRHPAVGEDTALLLEVGELLVEPAEPVLRRRVALLLERLALDLELDDAAVDLVERLGLGIDLHAQPRRGLVDEVDRLVRQEAVGDVAVGEGRRRDQRRIGDPDAVVQLVLLLDAAEDRDGVLDGRLADEDRLEAAGQRGVLLDVLAILVERGGADAMQLAAGQGRLEEVRRIHRAVGLAGADQLCASRR